MAQPYLSVISHHSIPGLRVQAGFTPCLKGQQAGVAQSVLPPGACTGSKLSVVTSLFLPRSSCPAELWPILGAPAAARLGWGR